MAKKIIHSTAAPPPIGPYSQAVQAGPLLFISGQIALTPQGELAGDDIVVQTIQVLENLKAILGAAGLGLEDVVKTTVYLTDLADFAEVNRVYAEYFPKKPPARATVQVAALPKGARLELEAVAILREGTGK